MAGAPQTIEGRQHLFKRILSRQPNNNLLSVKLHKSNFDAFKITAVNTSKARRASVGRDPSNWDEIVDLPSHV